MRIYGGNHEIHKNLILLILLMLLLAILTTTCSSQRVDPASRSSISPTLTKTIVPTFISPYWPVEKISLINAQTQIPITDQESWLNPVDNGIVTARLGIKWGGENICDPDYAGVDISAPSADVVAARSGIVIEMRYHTEFGNMISILHGGTLISHYYHLANFEPELYEAWMEHGGTIYVEAGQLLGKTGFSGVTGKYHPGGMIPTPMPYDRLLFIIVDGNHFYDPLELIPGNYLNGVCYDRGCSPCGNPNCCGAHIPPTSRPNRIADPFATPIPTATFTPTFTPTSTFTPTYTWTPSPTSTNTSTPTITPSIPASFFFTPTKTKSKPPPPPAPTLPPVCGALCWDGWISSATGSGACSSHGGVKEWLYEGDSRCP